MCRDKAHGGRRCPSASDPQKRAEVNAKRRERYRLKQEAQRTRGDTVLPQWVQEHLTKDTETAPTGSSLGITVEKFVVEENALDYFSTTQVQGKIDPTKLNPESYQEFGFVQYDSMEELIDAAKDGYIEKMTGWDELSETELENANLTPLQVNVIKEYTDSLYSSVNDVLRGQKNCQSKQTGDNADKEVNLEQQFLSVLSPRMTPQFVKQLTAELDQAVAQGPTIQRKVYRGISDVGISNSGMSRYRFLNENFSLGQEVVFDGYQSSSLGEATALDFAHDNGVCLEILTPDGLSVSSVAVMTNEFEIILPRGARYMTVGRQSLLNDNGEAFDLVQLVAIDEEGYVRHANRGKFVSPSLTDSQLTVED